VELDLQSLFGLLCTAVLMAETQQLPPTTRILAHMYMYTRARSVSQDRQHLFLIPWANCTFAVCTYAMICLVQACLEALEVLGLVDPGFNKWRGRLLTELNKARLYLTGQS
jgi:hypothetical protein